MAFDRVGSIGELVHPVAHYNGGNIERQLLRSARDIDFHDLIGRVQIKSSSQQRKTKHGVTVYSHYDVLGLDTRGACRAMGRNVGDHDAPVLRKPKAPSKRRSDCLREHSNFGAVDMAALFQALINELDNARRDCKTQPLATSAAVQDKRVESDHSPGDVY